MSDAEGLELDTAALTRANERVNVRGAANLVELVQHAVGVRRPVTR